MSRMANGGNGGGGGGGKQGKSFLQQQGWRGMAEQLLGPMSQRLSFLIGVGCIISGAYVALLLMTTHSCQSGYGLAGAPYFNRNANETDRGTVRLVLKEKKETSLDRIVFGIGGSADLWGNRSHYVNKWWVKGKTRGFVWFEKDLGDGWNPDVDPEYKVSEDTSHFRYTHKTGSKSAIRISRIVSETFRLGLPDVDWFVMGDDDTFFFTENLVAVLSKYDPKGLWYIGHNSEDHIQNQLFNYNMAYGGGGFAISYPLAEMLAKSQDSCIHRYPWLYGSDDRMKACMSELGVPLTKETGFHQFDVRGDVSGLLSSHPVTPIVTLHHLDAIYPIFPGLNRSASLERLVRAIEVSPHQVFQQSICYDQEKNWSFSLSWGYLINVYRGFVAPNVLEVPTITFLSWHRRREPYAFPFSTQTRAREICEEPSTYYMSQTVDGDEIRTVYSKIDRPNRAKACLEKLHPISLIKNIIVDSKALPREWVQNPRRQCCRIKEFKKTSLSMEVGPCGPGEILVPTEVESEL
jgi:hypothetical protein